MFLAAYLARFIERKTSIFKSCSSGFPFAWASIFCKSFALIASQVLEGSENGKIVTPVSTSSLIEDIARQYNAELIWTEVGSVVVSHRLIETNGTVGGEENGGVFYPPHLPVRDGAMTSVLILESMAKHKKKLSMLVSELPRYITMKTKVQVPTEKKSGILDTLLELTKDENRILTDGVKIISDNGWILLRPSGTESLWRCFAEGRSEDDAETLAAWGTDLLEKAIELT